MIKQEDINFKSRTKYGLIFYMIVLLLYGMGCFLKPGLERTSLKKWKIYEYPTLGTQVDLPKKSGLFFDKYLERFGDTENFYKQAKYKYVIINFHQIRSPAILADALFLIELSIMRMTEESFEKFKRSNHEANYHWKVESEIKFEPEIITREKKIIKGPRSGDYLCFRRDVRAPNGDVIIGIAELWTSYPDQTPETIEEDIQAIKRILHSIEPIKLEPLSEDR